MQLQPLPRGDAQRSISKPVAQVEHAEQLAGERLALVAEAAHVPAYVIFPDKTLIEMAETRPDSLDAMARISGVGAKKLERYGADFLSVITGAGEEMHPTRRRLAGRREGAVYDRLMQAQADLARGARVAGERGALDHEAPAEAAAEEAPATE